MKKGLVVTLGVALVLSAVPAFAEAPLLSCMPDIIISDLERTAQTADSNVFIFSDALDLDEYVEDADTSDTDLLWSFIDPDNAIRINAKGSVNPANVKAPGALNIRSGDGVIDIQNVAMGATSPTAVNLLTFYVSDGDKVSTETVSVRTVNVADPITSGTQDDALVAPVLRDWQFATDAENWTTFNLGNAGGWNAPTQTWASSALSQTEATGHANNIVFGSYESPKNPALGIQPKVGCILRARFNVTGGQAAGEASPGFRLHAITKHMALSSGSWVPQFNSLDFIDEQYVQYYTFGVGTATALLNADRLPDPTAKDFLLLYFPNQSAETLLSTSTVTYFAFEMLDIEGTFFGAEDSGSYNVNSVVVDAIDRPELGKGTAVSTLTITNFVAADWQTDVKTLDLSGIGITIPGGPNITGLTAAVDSGDLAITLSPGNQAFEASIFMKDGARLTAGAYVRMAWSLNATVTGNYAEPRIRLGVASQDAGVWSAFKEQPGGASIAGLTQEPSNWEHWFVAPAADPRAGAPAGMTEKMVARFSSFQIFAAEFPVTVNAAGTARALSVQTEEFAPIP